MGPGKRVDVDSPRAVVKLRAAHPIGTTRDRARTQGSQERQV